VIRWAVLWRQKGSIDGDIERIQWGYGGDRQAPYLFRTKKDCAVFIKERYGYIAKRKDLREYPHGWRMPKPIKVRVALIPVKD